MNKIHDVYDRITVDEDVLASMIENAKRQKLRRLPVGRITAIAAGFVIVLLLVGIPIFAMNQRSVFSSMERYDDTMMKEQGAVFEASEDTDSAGSRSGASSGASGKKGVDFDLIEQYPAMIYSGDLLYKAGDLSFAPEQAYYDGEYLMLAFRGSYHRKETDVERAEYVFGTDDSERFFVNREAVAPAYGSFYLVRTEEEFIGVLSAYVKTDTEQLDVQLTLPYLALEDRNGEILSVEEGPFEIDFFSVGRSDAPVSAYHRGTPPVLGATEVFSSPAGITVRFHAGRDCAYNPETVRPTLYDREGNMLEWIESEREDDGDGGVNVTARFAPSDEKSLTLRYYSDSGALLGEETLSLTAE